MTTSSFWNFISAAEDEYSVYRKRIMAKFSLSAAETDIIMFLANNPDYDTAADISKVRRILKSQVSVSVKSLCEKGLLTGTYKDGNKKSVHLSLTEKAKPVVTYGKRNKAILRLFCLTDLPMTKSPHLKDTILKYWTI